MVTVLSLNAVNDIQFNPKNWSVNETIEFAEKTAQIRDIKEFASKTKNNTGLYKVIYYVYVPKENKTATITVAEEYNLDKRGNACTLIDSYEKFDYDQDTLLKRAIGYFNYWTQKLLGTSTPIE
jgi:hypothetical protein